MEGGVRKNYRHTPWETEKVEIASAASMSHNATMPTLQMQLLEDSRVRGTFPFDAVVVLGRQDQGEPDPRSDNPFPMVPGSNPQRILIAPSLEKRISRRHVQMEPLGGPRVRLTNLSDTRSVRLDSGEELPRQGDKIETTLPLILHLGARALRIASADETAQDQLFSLSGQTMAPGEKNFGSLRTLGTSAKASWDGDVENLVRWIQVAMDVIHSAVNSDDFFQRAAEALVEMVGLDTGRVLLREGERWKVHAIERSVRLNRVDNWEPSKYILNQIIEQKRTFWKPLPSSSSEHSLYLMETVVAAPVLNQAGEVIGVLYGDRQRGSGGFPRPISRMEALLVELLAGGVAAGLARIHQEKAALKAQVQLENFFTPRLARILAEKPELLEGREALVTVLVCDIRNFSRITEKLGPATSIRWINTVMSALTECVLQEEGVVVDYVGDELMAMWGAPTEQPDQALRAARTTKAMIDCLPVINNAWAGQLQGPMSLGIGIHTGIAQVGNVGSSFKFKYGPLGNTVNLASRVQGVNKYLNTQGLITRTTRESLGSQITARRVGKIRVHNIQEPVDLFEPLADHQITLQTLYEQALTLFEEKAFHKAASILGRMLAEYPNDGPTLVLLSRTVQSLVSGPEKDHPVWVLENK